MLIFSIKFKSQGKMIDNSCPVYSYILLKEVVCNQIDSQEVVRGQVDQLTPRQQTRNECRGTYEECLLESVRHGSIFLVRLKENPVI